MISDIITKSLKGIRFALARSKLPNQNYSDPTSAQVVIGALKVTKVSLHSIYNDPASALDLTLDLNLDLELDLDLDVTVTLL